MATVRPPRVPSARAVEPCANAGPEDRPPPIRIPVAATTLAGFRAWATSAEFPRGLRATFLGDEIILDMSPEEIQTHIIVKNEIARVLSNLCKESRRGIYFADGTLISNEAAGLSNEPDGTFVTRASLRAGRVRLIPREGLPGQFMEIEGSPDWVLEIVSRWSVRKDTEELRAKYHLAGIPEYWLVDARGEDIDFLILSRRRDGYAATRAAHGGWQRSKVFGRQFRLVREPDVAGLWDYTLEVQ